MSARTRTLSALGGRTARRTAILATTPLLAASAFAAAPAQAAGFVGLEAFSAAEGLPDTAASCGTSCAYPDQTVMPPAGTLPDGTVAVFTVIGTVTSATATEFHVNAGAANPDVTVYTAAGTRVRNALVKGNVVKVVAARPATTAPAPLAIEDIRKLDASKAGKALVEHDFVSMATAPADLAASSWTVGTLSVDMVTAPAEIADDVVAGTPTLVQYTDAFVADAD
jgi:hypothetical protein